MMFIFSRLFFLCLLLSGFAYSQNGKTKPALVGPPLPAQTVLLNEVLFSESAGAWTQRDFELYKLVRKAALDREHLGQFVETDLEDFVLSRLTYRESLMFELERAPLKISDAERRQIENQGYTLAEINEELGRLKQAQSLVEIKESQLKQKIRFAAWYEVLKRKYKLKYKIIFTR